MTKEERDELVNLVEGYLDAYARLKAHPAVLGTIGERVQIHDEVFTELVGERPGEQIACQFQKGSCFASFKVDNGVLTAVF